MLLLPSLFGVITMTTLNNRKGMLFVLSGPSGVGKGTVAKNLLQRNANLAWSVSSTTRAPRSGEINGKDYEFLSKDEFQNKVKQGFFLEWAEVHGNHYGTSRTQLEKLLLEGKNVLIEIDVQGAEKIKNSGFPCKMIFLMPPSEAELKQRLNGRNSETEETLQIRLKTAEKELEKTKNYDYIIVNKDLVDTIQKIEKIINN